MKTVEELDKTTLPDLVLGEATQVMADILVGDMPNQHLPVTPRGQQTAKRLN